MGMISFRTTPQSPLNHYPIRRQLSLALHLRKPLHLCPNFITWVSPFTFITLIRSPHLFSKDADDYVMRFVSLCRG
ncbi:hypothetical protein GOP47_0029856 [Adiantum capillus-veneris]|nr:hypothetical protein GOP47_0029856 [Adiantum capillus-veneris]